MLLKRLFSHNARAPAQAPGKRLVVISATRGTEEEFWRDTRLGVTLPLAMFDGTVNPLIRCGNREGLPAVYNAALDGLPDEAIALCVHDDVSLYDFYLGQRLEDALSQFDVVGLAGNAKPDPQHAGWYFLRPPGGGLVAHDLAVLSGAVNHTDRSGPSYFSVFGPAPREVQLLDGLFLAFRVGTLRRHGVEFDENFTFHFYDIDFCRECVKHGLRLGTWPIAVGHEGAGNANFGTPAWERALAMYREKWR